MGQNGGRLRDAHATPRPKLFSRPKHFPTMQPGFRGNAADRPSLATPHVRGACQRRPSEAVQSPLPAGAGAWCCGGGGVPRMPSRLPTHWRGFLCVFCVWGRNGALRRTGVRVGGAVAARAVEVVGAGGLSVPTELLQRFQPQTATSFALSTPTRTPIQLEHPAACAPRHCWVRWRTAKCGRRRRRSIRVLNPLVRFHTTASSRCEALPLWGQPSWRSQRVCQQAERDRGPHYKATLLLAMLSYTGCGREALLGCPEAVPAMVQALGSTQPRAERTILRCGCGAAASGSALCSRRRRSGAGGRRGPRAGAAAAPPPIMPAGHWVCTVTLL
jgi:hypothetical protein